MKILVSAIACDPYGGSELYFGWSAVKALARDHDVWVMVSGRSQPDLERAAKEGLIPPNLRFAYLDCFKPWHPNRTLARIQSWIEYGQFTKASLHLARELHKAEHFDLVHHITYTTARVPSPLWQLGIPFILGPVCGNETFPFQLFSILSPTGATFELVRKLANVQARFSPAVNRSIRQAAHIFAITEEAVSLVASTRRSSANITKLSPGFYSKEKVSEFSRFVPDKNINGMLRLYAAGNLGGQKCIALAFQALARVKRQGVDFRYMLGAKGPELPHLKRLATRLGLEEQIIFGDRMSREQYQQELGRTHVYLLPSMRETVGLTMLEAMLAGCVPIVADNGGPKVTVTPECGYKIQISNPNCMADEIAGIILKIERDRKIITDKGAKASNRVATIYTEDHYRQTISKVYTSLTGQTAGTASANKAVQAHA